MKNSASLPWMAAGLAVILLGLFLLQDPVPEAPQDPTPEPRIARTAERAPGPRTGATPPAGSAQDSEAELEAPDEDPADTDSAAPDDNPFAVFLAPPEALTEGADRHPPMDSLDATDGGYSATIEARQLFAPFEQALLAAEPLGPGTYKELLTEFKDHNMKVLKRADWLRKNGHADAATDLMGEWGRLFDHYKAQAYGRPPVPSPGD